MSQIPNSQLKKPEKSTSGDVKIQWIINLGLISLVVGLLFCGFIIDWLISFFFGPIGCTITIFLSLIIATIRLIFKRNLLAWLTFFCIILLCVASYMATASLLDSRSYTIY